MPASKNTNRVQRNFVSAAMMLGHLCALYDRGIFEAARLMSNLLFQLTIERRNTNVPLLRQLNLTHIQIVVDARGRERAVEPEGYSPLAGIRFGYRLDMGPEPVPFAQWVPLFAQSNPAPTFSALSVTEWLEERVIPTGRELLSRGDLITFVRDQDGGAHSDTDERIARSQHYLELVDWFPMAKQSTIQFEKDQSVPWELLPPYTHVLMRQIAHELISAIYSNTDIGAIGPPPTLVVLFNDTSFRGAFVPRDYPPLDPIYGMQPREVDGPAEAQAPDTVEIR